VVQADAQRQTVSKGKFVSSDPPYYDNIGYAELSDFFYIWLRRTLRPVYSELFSTIAVPKAEELVATPYRHGGKEEAESFFLNGMTSAMRGLADQAHPAAPITIYYAFKQSETSEAEGTISAGWVSFLGAVSQSGLLLSGTWPLRTENASRMIGQGNNALASSIVLVCRKRAADAPSISRREFIRELNDLLPEALDEMTKGSGDERSPVAPVDLSQAIIGPGMAVFSKYAAVLEADGSPMSVRIALQLINRFLAEDDFDADTGVHDALIAALHELFPATRDARITHRWGGPLAVPRDWCASVHHDRATGTGSAGGYVGDGVSTTHLAGRTLADLVLGHDTDRTRLPWVQHHSPKWEPEPLRWLGINAGRGAAAAADRAERRTGREATGWGKVLGLFTGGH
jgi:adenine-specific DNA methylase